ncbi:MAG: saccharopine dehydrogenase NADP-binding domain-containing protein [Chloroflexi bacterium]|nr:saccharopine dehydrogenase NADP-binding domain-containing protein [Chloroflexota bacterium]
MSDEFLLYGANGFVGEVIARLAVQRGLKPTLAGRNAARVQALAQELGRPSRVFRLDDSSGMDKALREVPVVLNCAGPYVNTATPMVDGCLRTGTHYLDLSGGIVDYEAIAARDAEAKAKQVMLLPGVGFDVVPTDGLALHLKERLPSATHLRLAFCLRGPSKLPPGTLNTILDGMTRYKPGAIVRRNGQLESVPPEWREVDFGKGPVRVVRSIWGDVFSSFYSTGIPNMEEYIGYSEQQVRQMGSLRKLGPLLKLPFVQNYIRRQVPTGPTAEERAQARTLVWGEVEDDRGHKAVSRLCGPEGGVTWTSVTAVAAVQKVLEGHAPPGYQTPAKAYGPDFGLECEGVTREDDN